MLNYYFSMVLGDTCYKTPENSIVFETYLIPVKSPRRAKNSHMRSNNSKKISLKEVVNR